MTAALTFTRDFVYGMAQLIAVEVDPSTGIAWRAPGTSKYQPGEVGIYAMSFPVDITGQAAGGKAIAFTPYPLGEDPVLGDATIGLQIRSRASSPDVREAWMLDDAIFDVLGGRYGFALPTGIDVVQIGQRTSTSLGKDDANRAIWSSSYPVELNRPSTHRH